MSEIPEGYELAENSYAKNVVYDALEASLDAQDVEWYDDDEELIDLIGLADDIVEALLAAGVTIPEDIKNPHQI